MPSVMQQKEKDRKQCWGPASRGALCQGEGGGRWWLFLARALPWARRRSWARPSRAVIRGWGDDCPSSTTVSLPGAHQGELSVLPGTLCLHSTWCAPAVPQGSGGRGEPHRQTHTSAGGFDEKVKNSNQTISFSSYSEAGNNDLSHMFQTWESTSATCF